MLGVIAVGGWLASNDPSLQRLMLRPSMLSAKKTEGAFESSVVSVGTQAAGSLVIVESVTVPPPGVWVAVREVNGNYLGNVLGATRVKGPRSAISISLLRATEPGLRYAIQLYRDDTGGEFDLSADSVYVDFATGAPAIAYFTTK